jgi:hypothetical protein
MASKSPRLFTLGEADATLPLVRAIVGDIVRVAQSVADRRERLAAIRKEQDDNPSDVYRAEVLQVEATLDTDTRQLQEYTAELRRLGVEPTSVIEGVVDFPANVEGQSARWCWKLGESKVGFWHKSGEGFEDRRPITPT